MKKQRLHVAAALIGLSAPILMAWSAPAVAQSYGSPQYQRDNDWDRRGYPQYPTLQSMRRVSWLARSVGRAAMRLENDTFIRRSSLTYRERRALGQIQGLTRAASHFRGQVESYQRDPEHTQSDFERLVRAYYVAGQALDNVDATGQARSDFETLQTRMQELMRNYGGYTRWSRFDRYHGPYYRGSYSNSD